MINDTYGPFLRLGFGQRWAEQMVDKLMEAYAEPHRAYHNMTHILSCLYGITSYSHLAKNPDEIAVALWFHDSIYDTHRDDNESRSAVWAEEELLANQVDSDIIQRVSNLIRATTGHDNTDDFDTKLMLDIDLSILGTPISTFEKYDEQIRREYWWVDEDDYNFLRAKVLQTFLDRDKIYNTSAYENNEQQARENLTRKIAELND